MAAVPRGGALPPYTLDFVTEDVRGAEIRRAGFNDAETTRRFHADLDHRRILDRVRVLLEVVDVGLALLVVYFFLWGLYFQAAG